LVNPSMYAEKANTAVRLGSVSRRYRQPIGARAGRLAGIRPGVAPRQTLMLLGDEALEEIPRGDGPAARSVRLAQLEAVLFLSQQPQGSRKLAELTGLADGTKARTLVRSLNKRYDIQGSAFRVEEVAGGFQLMTRPEFAPWLRRLHGTNVEVRLSAPAMETLSVVAYRQPILRAEIEAVRGVQCGEILRQLIERNLVRIAGRSEELGRPFLYGTTRRFLEIFGLRNLDELPRAERFRPPADPDPTKSNGNVKADQDEADKEMMKQANESSETESSETVEGTNVNSTLMENPELEELLEEPPADATAVPTADLPEDDPTLDDEQEDEEYEDDEDSDEEDDEEYEYEDVDEDEEEDDDYEYEYEDDEEDEDDEEEYEDDDDLDEDVWEEVGDDDEEEEEEGEEEEYEEDEEEWEYEDDEEDDGDDEESWYDEDEEE